MRGYLAGILIIAASASVIGVVDGDTRRRARVGGGDRRARGLLPCAVALAFPLADELATLALRRRGVFVRDGGVWSRLNRVRHVIFDKTGTLTLETPVLLNPGGVAGPRCRRALCVARSRQWECSPREPMPPRTPPRRGSVDTGVPAKCVKRPATASNSAPGLSGRPAWRAASVGSGSRHGIFQCSGRVVARFHFADSARPDVKIELARLAERGLTAQILSGDRRRKSGAPSG